MRKDAQGSPLNARNTRSREFKEVARAFQGRETLECSREALERAQHAFKGVFTAFKGWLPLNACEAPLNKEGVCCSVRAVPLECARNSLEHAYLTASYNRAVETPIPTTTVCNSHKDNKNNTNNSNDY